MSSEQEIPLIARAREHAERMAIRAVEGEFTYRDLLEGSAGVASALGASGLRDGEPVAFLVPPGFTHVRVEWGIWRAGGIAVPLCESHPEAELDHVVGDSGAGTLIAHPELEAVARGLAAARGARFLSTAQLPAGGGAPPGPVSPEQGALILYTSGTTGRPKGVLLTHGNVRAQVESLVAAWEWQRDDRILHVLPLHHVHGIVNVLCCALWSGAVCEMLPRFDSREVWRRLAAGDLTLFMAVPTIYVKLIAAWEEATPEERARWAAGCTGLRLMVSGSAALPVPVLERWQAITGHRLLERYGMTEIGMALSNPLRGERVAGAVGAPLPGVEVRLVDEKGAPVDPGTPGEIEVRGPGVFREYWRRPEETRDAFREKWFRTGDVALLENGVHRILGRRSVDIIKTGGYKVSALEIEEVYRTHPDIEECAVVGVPDPEWGERVAAAVIPKAGRAPRPEDLRDWGKTRLAAYKVPRRFLLVAALPRNAMGKVTKPEVRRQLESEEPGRQ